MTPIIDVEMPIWNGGQLQSTPITSFASYFQSLKNAGWRYVASEGGRTGDLAYMKNYFQGYVNFNCDQCGLWKGYVYKDPFTVANSWESYYPSEVPYIQTRINSGRCAWHPERHSSLARGLIAAATTRYYANSLSGGSPSHIKSMLDWSYANGIGFTSFHVWCGDNPQGLSQYKACGFESIVANLQTYYPPTSSSQPRARWSTDLLAASLLPAPAQPLLAERKQPRPLCTGHGRPAVVEVYYERSELDVVRTGENLGGTLTSSPAAASPARRDRRLCPRHRRRPLGEATTNGGAPGPPGPVSAGSLLPAQDQRCAHRAAVSTSLYRAPTAPSSIRTGTARVVGWQVPRRGPDLVTRRDVAGVTARSTSLSAAPTAPYGTRSTREAPGRAG